MPELRCKDCPETLQCSLPEATRQGWTRRYNRKKKQHEWRCPTCTQTLHKQTN